MNLMFLTAEMHRNIVAKLVALGQKVDGTKYHAAGAEYTSLMMCFLLHNLSAAGSLLRLYKLFGKEWFPATVGYAIARTTFETDVTAHYITQSPIDRSRQYISYGAILTKREMDACQKHCLSDTAIWREAMKFEWENRWKHQEVEVNNKYASVITQYQKISSKRKDHRLYQLGRQVNPTNG